MAATEDKEIISEVQPFRFVDDTRLLQASLSKYFNKPLFSDITVIGPDGRKLLCHQVVLSAGSKRFANMLEQGNLANEELPVWGVDSDALQSLIEFFYSGACTLTFPGAVAVMDAANRLDVPSLSSAADTYVREALTARTATTILDQCLQFKLGELVAACLEVISNKFDEVAASKDFVKASFETLKRILAHVQDSGKVSEEDVFRAAWKWTISEPSHPNHFDAVLKVVRVPASISFAELLQSSQQHGGQGMPAAAAAAMAAAAAAACSTQEPTPSQQQQPSNSQGRPSLGAPSGAADPVKAEAPPDTGKEGTEQASQQQQQRPGSSAAEGAGAGAGTPADAAAAAAAAAAAPPATAACVDALMVDVPEVPEAATGPASTPHHTSQPQGTLSSFDPLSGGPTPTSKALTATLDGNMFAVGAGGPADMAAAAAAAAAAGMDPAVAMGGQMDPQLAAMYAGGYPMAGGKVEGGGAAAGAGGAEGAASGAEGGSGQPVSPSKMQGWGGMGGMQMGGMQMGGMMPGFMPGMHMMGPMGPMMGPMMGMMPGYMSTGRNHAKGVCQVEGCNADLRGLRDYHLRYKICEYHLKVSSIIRDGVHQRFCQQCGRFHPLQDFDGAKRSCRARLLRHNARRRKRGEEELAAMGYGSSSSMKRGRGSFSQMPDMDDPATAAAAASGGYWPMMGVGGNMDPYMAMAMGYGPDSANYNAMMQYGQYGMMSPTGSMMPNPTDMTAAAAAAVDADGGGGGSSAAKRGVSSGSDKVHKEGCSEADWDEGDEGEGAQDEDRARDEVAWAAAGLEMLADVAQARSSAAGDRSRPGSDAGSKPSAGAGEAEQQQQQQQADGTNNNSMQQQQPQHGSARAAKGQQQQPGSGKAAQGGAGAAHTTAAAAGGGVGVAGVNSCSVVPPLQLADSPSPHATSGGLFVGRVSPGHDAHPTEPGADATTAAAAAAAAGVGGKHLGAPGASAGAAAGAACVGGGAGGDGMHRLANGGASGSPSNDLAFRADKPGAAAGTVQG